MKALCIRFNAITNKHPLLTMLASMLVLLLAWSMLPADPPAIDAPQFASRSAT